MLHESKLKSKNNLRLLITRYALWYLATVIFSGRKLRLLVTDASFSTKPSQYRITAYLSWTVPAVAKTLLLDHRWS
jgi:hypothetical protein